MSAINDTRARTFDEILKTIDLIEKDELPYSIDPHDKLRELVKEARRPRDVTFTLTAPLGDICHAGYAIRAIADILEENTALRGCKGRNLVNDNIVGGLQAGLKLLAHMVGRNGAKVAQYLDVPAEDWGIGEVRGPAED